MEEIEHFSHEHPLTFFQDIQDDEYDDQKPYKCRVCGLPILSSPSYTCTINTNCNFFLHKPCAQLQESVARPVEIKSKHKSHKAHPLVANGRQTLCLCDACGEEHKGYFFSCHQCNFWIHQDCTLLLRFMKLSSHSHPFILTYSLPRYEPLGRDEGRCVVCRGRRGVSYSAVYFCGQCNFFAHASCAKSNMENLESETKLDLIQLPSDDKWDTFPSLVIRRILQRNKPTPSDNNLTIDHHNHPLILDDHATSSTSSTNHNKEMHCDLCIQPITNSSPFYKCLQPNCHFLVHNICAVQPSKVLFNTETKSLFAAHLYPHPGKLFFCSTFACYYCRRPCNGSCFYTITENFIFFVDLECAAAPNSIKHTSHGRHVLFRTSYYSSTPLSCCSSPCRDYYDVYRCVSCDFFIHVGCALLPKMIRHEFDEHSLELITTATDYGRSHCYCEFCEEEIDEKYWLYGCSKCEQWFHIKCVPSVGYLSKVKFGKAFVDDNVHQHPLVLTRMIMLGRKEVCGCCNKIVRGFIDEMAFCCLECDFWIHFLCANDFSSAHLRTYLEYAIDPYSCEDF